MVRWEVDWLENRARLTPDRIALVEAEGNYSLTYGELVSNGRKLACWLKAKGIQKGDRVALLAPNSVMYFELLFACSKLGAIFVPINWRLTSREIEYILEDCSPKVILFHGKYTNCIRELTPHTK
ncbi:AMP-binding protein [Robertmurraya sp. P23]|uniref:AMP-binding protein n=1 Tax=Robertmurraya sp. P23 TaxID=3436931 RepID=UPI003D98917D